jgi:hypothetical protein
MISGRGMRLDVVSNLEHLDKCRDGGLHNITYGLGRVGTKEIYYFHPQIVEGPYFACALCGALIVELSPRASCHLRVSSE